MLTSIHCSKTGFFRKKKVISVKFKFHEIKPEVYSETSQRFKMELFSKILVNIFKKKKFYLNVRLDSGYAFGNCCEGQTKNQFFITFPRKIKQGQGKPEVIIKISHKNHQG